MILRHTAAIATVVVVAITGGLAAGCDSAVEMKLVPTGDEVETSCVNAVELTLTGRLAEEETYYCKELSPGDVRSLRDHGLEGIFDVTLPPFDIIGIQLRGVSAAQGCVEDRAVGPTIFVASSDEIDDSIDLAMRGVLSCADRVDTPTPVRVVDFMSLVTDGSCVPIEGLLAQPGQLFPTMLYNNYNGVQWWFYFWAPPSTTPATGMLEMPYTFSASSTGSCVGLYSFDGDACLTPPGRGACGAETEFQYIDFATVRDASLSIEDQLAHYNVVFGVVLDRMRRPIPGATITTTAPGAIIQYTQPAGAGFARVDAASTTATGTFTVLADRPALIEVSAPGHATRRVMAGGTSATVVVMDTGATM